MNTSRSRSPRHKHQKHRREKTPGSTCILISGFHNEITDEDALDLVINKVIRFDGMKRVEPGAFHIRLYDDSAVEEMMHLHGETYRGRRLSVDYAPDNMAPLIHPFKPTLEKKTPNCQTLFVGNIVDTSTEEDLRTFFQKAPGAQIVSCSMRKGGFKGMMFAHVKFVSPEACERAVSLAGNSIKGTKLRLDWAQDKSSYERNHTQAPPPIYQPPFTPPPPVSMVPPPPMPQEFKRSFEVTVQGLTESLERRDIVQHFSRFGQILDLNFKQDHNGMLTAAITYDNRNSAELAVQSEHRIGETLLSVEYTRNAKRRKISQNVERTTPVSYQLPADYAPQVPVNEFYNITSY